MGVLGTGASGAMRVFGKVADNPSINSFFLATSFASMSSSGIGTTMDAAQDAHAVDRNTFERAGQGVGNTLAGVADVGVAGMWLGHGIRRIGAAQKDAFMSKDGGMFAKTNAGIFNVSANGKLGSQLAAAEGEHLMANAASRGVIGSGKWYKGAGSGFLKNAGWKMMAGTVLAPMAMSMLAAPVLGFAGKLVDEMYNQSRKSREVKYDERYIVNQQQDMTTNQSVGAAMDAYQNKMMSMSRIYHSR